MASFLICLPRYHTNAVPWVRVLRGAGHSVAIHVQRFGATEDHSLAVPVKVPGARWAHRLGQIMPRREDADFYAAPPFVRYWRMLKRENPDVVIVRGVSRWFCRMAAVIALLQRRQLVIYDQEEPLPEPWSGTWLRRAGFRLIGVPHFTARLPRQPAEGGAGLARSIPFGAMEESAAMERAARDLIRRPLGRPRILMVAKYRRRKGHLEFIAALRELAEGADFTVTFCGEQSGAMDDDFVEKLEMKLEESGLADRASFRNNLARGEMQQLYREHDIFVLPSKDEPAAVSPIEAVWNGCAALMDEHSGTRHYLPAGGEFSFSSADPSDIARALRPLVLDPAALQRAREACLDHIVQVASDSIVLDRLTEFLPKREP